MTRYPHRSNSYFSIGSILMLLSRRFALPPMFALSSFVPASPGSSHSRQLPRRAIVWSDLRGGFFVAHPLPFLRVPVQLATQAQGAVPQVHRRVLRQGVRKP